MNSRDREALRAVTKEKPCPVCGGTHKCSIGEGGLIICGRRDGPVSGFRYLGPANGDPQFHLFRFDDGTEPQLGRSTMRKRSKSPLPRDWGAIAKKYADSLTPDGRDELAKRLRLPVAALDALSMLGVSRVNQFGSVFTFPERGSDGEVIGITERIPNAEDIDEKRMIGGGKRGLTVPEGWGKYAGPILVVEGATDVLALSLCELSAIGRFSNTGGAEQLVALLAKQAEQRPIIVLGEHDKKTDGRWPGREGAERTASKMAQLLGRNVSWALTPNGLKDAREWVVQRGSAGKSVDWYDVGQQLLLALNVVSVHSAVLSMKPKIILRADEYCVNDEASKALGSDPDLYQRGGVLVRVTSDPPPASRSIRRPSGPRVEAIATATLRERLTRCAEWRKVDRENGELVELPAHPPAWSVQAVHSRGEWPDVRVLEGVVEYPVFLADGRILATPGYDRETGILYHPPFDLVLDLPAHPTQSHARDAAARLLDVVGDFPFAGAEDKAAWLAAVLTPLARFGFTGPAPLFLAEANCRGAGKGLLLDVVARIVTGQSFAVCTYTNDREEMRKVITSIALQGDRMVLFDNLDGPFGGSVIDMALTGEAWQGRLLGTNNTIRVPLSVVWFATGNNVSVIGDTARRVCPFRLETALENPERRGDFRRPDLLGWVEENRASLLSDVLTILRGWHLAGRPDMKLAPWGSFGGWSTVVRNAAVWCGQCDPGDTRTGLQARADTTADSMRSVLIGLEHLDPMRRGLTAAEILDRVFTSPRSETAEWFRELRIALDELLSRRDSRQLGYRLRSFRRRVIADRYLDTPLEKSHGSARWVVYPASDFRSGCEGTNAETHTDREENSDQESTGALFDPD